MKAGKKRRKATEIEEACYLVRVAMLHHSNYCPCGGWRFIERLQRFADRHPNTPDPDDKGYVLVLPRARKGRR